MKRLVIATVAGLVVLSSCGGGSEPAPTSEVTTSTTEAPSPDTTAAISTSSTGPSTTTTTTSTTAAPPPEPPRVFPDDAYVGLPAIVTSADGVSEVAPNGAVRQLIDGRVAFAIDDTQGGLLYQIDRGRDWDGTANLDTRIWWLPAGSILPQELLVPTRTEGHELSLHDAYYDDGIQVIYVRHEGDRSHDYWPFNAGDRLRSFDVAGRSATDLVHGSAYEAGIGYMQCGADLIAYTDLNQIGTNCEFIDYGGFPVTIPADVETRDCEIDCRRSCAIGWNGALLMYSQDHLATADTIDGVVVVFAHAQTGEEIARVTHLSPYMPEFVDLLGNRVLLSWSDRPGGIYDMAHLERGATTLPIAGLARFAKAPIELPAVVSID